MIVRRSMDIWRCAIVKQRADELGPQHLTAGNIIWLPETRPFAFRADPFGLWHEDKLHIFAEAFDYRTRKGAIELMVYDGSFNPLRSEIVLNKPWHLSYPYVFKAGDDFWMLPEARRSGELMLYRAQSFPAEWEPIASIDLGRGMVDATPLFDGDRWWLFYAHAQHGPDRMSELNVAYSDHLTGPWRAHPLNPVRRGLASTRPAGRPLVRADGRIELPVQDCTKTYGGGVRRLTISRLDEQHFEAEDAPWLYPLPELAPYTDGLHTLSGAGGVTLIDCKKLDLSMLGRLVRFRGSVSRRLHRWGLHLTNGSAV